MVVGKENSVLLVTGFIFVSKKFCFNYSSDVGGGTSVNIRIPCKSRISFFKIYL